MAKEAERESLQEAGKEANSGCRKQIQGGIAGIPQGNRHNPALVPNAGSTTKCLLTQGSRPAFGS
jgi:hypothetical protein